VAARRGLRSIRGEWLRYYEICNKALIGNWKNQVKAEKGAGEGGGAGESGCAEVVRVLYPKIALQDGVR
jgi:hypothetical protein